MSVIKSAEGISCGRRKRRNGGHVCNTLSADSSRDPCTTPCELFSVIPIPPNSANGFSTCLTHRRSLSRFNKERALFFQKRVFFCIKEVSLETHPLPPPPSTPFSPSHKVTLLADTYRERVALDTGARFSLFSKILSLSHTHTLARGQTL